MPALNSRRSSAAFIAALAMLAGSAAHGATVSFNQLDWVATGGGYTAFNSEWGYAGIQFGPGDAGSFFQDEEGFFGYVNLYTQLPGGDANWAVKNMPIRFADAADLATRTADGFHFNLGIDRGAQSVSSLGYEISIDPAPVAGRAARGGGPLPLVPVVKDEVLFGGEGGMDEGGPFIGGTGQNAPMLAQNFDALSDSELAGPPDNERGGAGLGRGTHTAGIKKPGDVPKVDEKKNHCAPGAVTRGLQYLKSQNPGLNITQDTAQMQGSLSSKMGTTEANGTANSDKIVQGKQSYVDQYGLPIVTDRTRDVCAAYETLKNGGVVEMGVNWGKDAAGKSMGAHRAFVQDIEKTMDANGNVTGYRVHVIDDKKQGDGVATNRDYWLAFNSNNTLKNYGTGAQLINFITEKVTPTPTPGAGALLAAAGLMGLRRRRIAA